MNGVAAVRQVLAADSALTALVPATRISAGVMPPNTALPAIALNTVSAVDRNIPAPGALRRVLERVQVTVLAANYPSQRAILAAVRKAAADKMPSVSGISQVVILTDGTGPDIMDETASIYLGSQDFSVSFNEAR